MFAVVSCKKYAAKTLRIADVGDRSTIDEVNELLDKAQCMECPICGPCSHVELSWRNWFNVHSVWSTQDEAVTDAEHVYADNPDAFCWEAPVTA